MGTTFAPKQRFYQVSAWLVPGYLIVTAFMSGTEVISGKPLQTWEVVLAGFHLCIGVGLLMRQRVVAVIFLVYAAAMFVIATVLLVLVASNSTAAFSDLITLVLGWLYWLWGYVVFRSLRRQWGSNGDRLPTRA